MARARNIKPAFFKNEHLAEVSPEARLLFIGLWTLADCEGRLEDRPKKIKAEIFPFDSYDVNELLNELQSCGGDFLVRYEANGIKCIQISNFTKHQNPHKNERQSGSQFPEIPEKNGTTPDFSGAVPEQDGTAPAESLLLNPESGIPHTETGTCASEPTQFVADGIETAAKSGNANMHNWGWVSGYLTLKEKEFSSKPIEALKAVWAETCTLAASKSVSSAQWYMTTFEGKLSQWIPGQNKHPPRAYGSQVPGHQISNHQWSEGSGLL